MDAIIDRARGGDARHLLVMLPGAMDAPQDFVTHGFVDALRRNALPVDVVMAAANVDYYLEAGLSETLHGLIARVQPEEARPVWFLGISLGAMGALTYARDYPSAIAGVILLAPFLGVQGTIEEVLRAGGLEHWEPGEIAGHDAERRLLAWLKSRSGADAALPPVYLAYGRDDRFRKTSEMLAEMLPADRVIAADGAHDWPTWRKLWDELLRRDLFARSSGVEY